MTQEEIIRMAREAGFEQEESIWGQVFTCELEMIKRFANLVEQRVRSEIALDELAKISEELGGY